MCECKQVRKPLLRGCFVFLIGVKVPSFNIQHWSIFYLDLGKKVGFMVRSAFGMFYIYLPECEKINPVRIQHLKCYCHGESTGLHSEFSIEVFRFWIICVDGIFQNDLTLNSVFRVLTFCLSERKVVAFLRMLFYSCVCRILFQGEYGIFINV